MQLRLVLSTDKPDLALVDEIARLQRAAARYGWRVSVEDASDDFVELVDFAGLRDVLSVEMGGELE